MTSAVVDLEAFRRNIDMLTERVAPARLMVVVKSDAYGHGLLPMSRTAVEHGVRLLGVLDAASALELRSQGIGEDVRLFAWLFGASEDYGRLIDADVDLGISHLHQLERIAEAATARSRPWRAARLHLKIDTGLHRNGASETEWPRLVTAALELEATGAVEIYGAWTHISEASYEEDSAAIARFERAIAVAESLGAVFAMRHLAASAAGHARPDSRFDVVRAGAFCYGVAPGDGIGPDDVGIEPVLTLVGEVSELRSRGRATFARVATGFLDGIPSSAAERVQVAIRGRLYGISSVSAGYLDVDVTGDDDGTGDGVASGDPVTFFGATHAGEWTLQKWADALDTIGEEILVRLAPSIRRHYSG